MINTKEKAKEIKDLIDNYLDKMNIIKYYETMVKNTDDGYTVEIEYSRGDDIIKKSITSENHYDAFEMCITIINEYVNVFRKQK